MEIILIVNSDLPALNKPIHDQDIPFINASTKAVAWKLAAPLSQNFISPAGKCVESTSGKFRVLAPNWWPTARDQIQFHWPRVGSSSPRLSGIRPGSSA